MEADPQTLQELNQMLAPDLSMYPRQPVALNEEWNGDTAALAKQFQLGADDKVSLKCKLLAVKEDNGRQVADISLVGQVLKHEQGFVEIRTTLGGVSRIDLQTGQTLTGDVLGKIISRGSQQVAGPDGNPVNVSVNAEGEVQVHQRVKMLNDRGPAIPAQGGFNIAGNNPAPPAAPQTQMPAPQAATFAGTFTNEKLSLELGNEGGRYTGALTLAGKKLPVTAKAEGNKLTGTFESDGTKFDFIATLEGPVLTLSSDGNTYNLKKAVANPLAQPAPRNPLGN